MLRITLSILFLITFQVASLPQPTGPNYLMAIPKNSGASKMVHYKYDYYVVSKNGETKKIKGKIVLNKKDSSYTLYNKKDNIRISPNETEKIYRITKTGDTITGMLIENKWLFLLFDGKLKGYSTYSTKEKRGLTYLQKGGGKLYLYTKKFYKHDFSDLIKDDDLTYKLYMKDKKRRNIRTIGPPALFALSATISFLSPSQSAVQIISWFGIVIFPIVPLAWRRIPPMEIINFYNRKLSPDSK